MINFLPAYHKILLNFLFFLKIGIHFFSVPIGQHIAWILKSGRQPLAAFYKSFVAMWEMYLPIGKKGLKFIENSKFKSFWCQAAKELLILCNIDRS
jgi:hypothetical protein